VLRVGIIGTGLIAREHAQAISTISSSATVLAAADLVEERLQEFCASFQVSRRYRDAADVIADPDVDLVTITTPPAAHQRFVIPALDAGKYVYCEKPLAHTLASANRILEADLRHPGRVTVGYQLRYESSFRRALWLCQNNQIGKIESALIERHSFIPQGDHGADGWWGSWKVAGGGVLITQLIHELDFLFLIFGPPVSVKAEMDTRFTDSESEDYVQATFRFAQAREARCIASVNSGHISGRVEIQGTGGTVRLPWHFATKDPSCIARALKKLDNALPGTESQSFGLAGRASVLARLLNAKPKPALTPHALLYEDIANSIANGYPLPIPPSEALLPLEACFGAYESAITGSEVEFPLSATSAIYGGVSKEAYKSRLCSRTVPKLDIASRSNSSSTRSLERNLASSPRQFVLGAARRALALLNIDPVSIRAAVCKPEIVHGGPRTRRWPWPRRRHFDRQERQAVIRVINREICTGNAIIYGGEEEKAYCEAFENHLGGGYAKAVNSGTTALYVALRALDLEVGSEVVAPPMTDPGGVMPIALVGCVPIPADTDGVSLNTCAKEIERVLSDRTSAIVVAHISGHPVEMNPILELAAKRRIPVIEDCAQAHGATCHGQMVGTFGTISAFSTMYAKHHATGAQGGVVFTKDDSLFQRVKQIADRGKPHGARGAQGNLIASLNFNQDEISMAIGRVQLEKLQAGIDARRAFASLVEIGLRDMDGVSLIREPHSCLGSYLFLTLHLDAKKIGCDNYSFAAALQAEGIGGVEPGYVFPTDQPWYRDPNLFRQSGLGASIASRYANRRPFALPNARQLNREIVRVDIHESLGAREAKDLVKALKKITSFYRVYYTAPPRQSTIMAEQ
jgi:perosamine synthetase